MRPRRHVVAIAVALTAALAGLPAAAAADPAALVDTRNGSLGPGFPAVGASVPFGLIQPGPDTSMPGDQQDPVDYVGYSYQDPEIRGFSLTHFDGAGIHIAGDLPFMPTTGAVSPGPNGLGSPYDHATEMAQPGYYAVTLSRYQTRVQLTGTTRAAAMRFTFPATRQANVLAEVSQSVGGANPGSVNIVGNDELQGWVKSDVGYTVYFDAIFDRPFAASAISGTGTSAGASATFDTTSNPVVNLRVGISYTSLPEAQANLAAELPAGRTFDQVRRAARQAWDQALASIRISGGRPTERWTFYDNLYRVFLLPSVLDDADGNYLGMDGAVHQVGAGHHHYSDLSLWDTYRSQTPLLELVAPGVARDVMASLLSDADQNHGVIPRWVQANIDRGIMAGDSGSATLADGAAEGLLSPADTQRALSDLVTQGTTLPPVWPREHLDAYLKHGYIPYDIDQIGTSVTEEYNTDDYAVAQLANALGDSADAGSLGSRSGYWHNLVDPANHFIQPRNSDGSWASPPHSSNPGFSGVDTSAIPLPYSPDFQDGYQEATGWQDLWGVPHDVAGLAQAIGGVPVAIRRLDHFFSTALNQPLVPVVPLAQQYSSFFGVYYIGNQYTPVNEPDLWAPWYYDWYGQPWKTQKVARAEMSVFNAGPYGLPGNDDAGEMSAWYVLAALGLYHVAPGVDAWELSSPAFPEAVLRQDAGPSLTIDAPGASAAKPYVHGLQLNGAPVNRTFLTTCQLRSGGELGFTLGALPDHSWGTGAGAAPPSGDARSADVEACAAGLASSGPA